MRFHALRGSSLATLACVLAGSLVLSACATMGGEDETPAAADSSGAEARQPLARGLDAAANQRAPALRLKANGVGHFRIAATQISTMAAAGFATPGHTCAAGITAATAATAHATRAGA